MKKPRFTAKTKRFVTDLLRPVVSSRLPLSEIWPRVRFSSDKNKPCSFFFNSAGDYWISLSPQTTAVLSNYALMSLELVVDDVSAYTLAASSLMHEYAHVLWFRGLPTKTLRLFDANPSAASISEVPALWLQADTIAKLSGIPRQRAFEILAGLAGIPIEPIQAPDDEAENEDEEDGEAYASALAIAMSYGPAVTIEDVVDEAISNSLDMVCHRAGTA